MRPNLGGFEVWLVATVDAIHGLAQEQVTCVNGRPHDAQRERARSSSRFFAAPARTISHAAPADEITAADWLRVN